MAQSDRELLGQKDIEQQMTMLKLFRGMSLKNAIGACAGFLLQCAYSHPDIVRRVLNEKVVHGQLVKEGVFGGESLLSILNKL